MQTVEIYNQWIYGLYSRYNKVREWLGFVAPVFVRRAKVKK